MLNFVGMLKEFPSVIVIAVYIPPSADTKVVRDIIYSTAARLQTQHLNAFIAMTVDLNHITLDRKWQHFNSMLTTPLETIKHWTSCMQMHIVPLPFPPTWQIWPKPGPAGTKVCPLCPTAACTHKDYEVVDSGD